jgi:hypothetical protein
MALLSGWFTPFAAARTFGLRLLLLQRLRGWRGRFRDGHHVRRPRLSQRFRACLILARHSPELPAVAEACRPGSDALRWGGELPARRGKLGGPDSSDPPVRQLFRLMRFFEHGEAALYFGHKRHVRLALDDAGKLSPSSTDKMPLEAALRTAPMAALSVTSRLVIYRSPVVPYRSVLEAESHKSQQSEDSESRRRLVNSGARRPACPSAAA